jgi:hypothetical protein
MLATSPGSARAGITEVQKRRRSDEPWHYELRKFRQGKTHVYEKTFMPSIDRSSQINQEDDGGMLAPVVGRPWTLTPICGVGGLKWKGLNTIPRLLYLQTSPSDHTIKRQITTAGLVQDEYFAANRTRHEVARGDQSISLRLFSIHTFAYVNSDDRDAKGNRPFVSQGGYLNFSKYFLKKCEYYFKRKR